MSFYPCRVGGDGKSPLNKEFQVAGCVGVYNPNKPQTISAHIADADFIILVSFYKSDNLNGTFILNGTNNQCVCTIGKVGDSVIVDGVAKFSGNKLTSNVKGRFTWETSDKVKIENVEGSSVLDGAVGVFFCKYI